MRVTSGALLAVVSGGLLAACQPQGAGGAGADGGLPGNDSSTQPYDGIGADETLRFTGTEPFWGGDVTGTSLTYSTIEDQDGTVIEVERFAGRGGISYGGKLDGRDFEMTVTELGCSDGMSDRTYPFTITLLIGDETRNGCGWTGSKPFEGPEAP